MALSSRCCEYLPDDFCYIYGEYNLIKNHMRSHYRPCRTALSCVFWCETWRPRQSWAHHKICVKCLNDLRFWLKEKKTAV
ncbi:hypothetical protein TNCT_360831 [Trichonephila clavata]|uniref:Uncharacterized protein n=1 Tax=Trichonephila clavata TaxID=2740835 RepID=A0A8X6GH69_TRICU|nr:hypothetical protein TNCT_360831 [Trichonephila clavata]